MGPDQIIGRLDPRTVETIDLIRRAKVQMGVPLHPRQATGPQVPVPRVHKRHTMPGERGLEELDITAATGQLVGGSGVAPVRLVLRGRVPKGADTMDRDLVLPAVPEERLRGLLQTVQEEPDRAPRVVR